jgi:hypothetical protein
MHAQVVPLKKPRALKGSRAELCSQFFRIRKRLSLLCIFAKRSYLFESRLAAQRLLLQASN